MKKNVLNPITGEFDVVDIQTEFYVDLASFPVTGKANTVYVDKTTKKQYLWNGLIYEAVSAELTLQQVTDNGNFTTNTIEAFIVYGFDQLNAMYEDGSIYANGGYYVGDNNTSNRIYIAPINALTFDRTQTLQDASGTIALTSDIPSTESIQDAIGSIVDASLVYTDATPLLSRAALTGDVTASEGSNTTAIANSVVTNTKLAQMPANTVKVNNTASVANPIDLNLPINTVLGNDTGLITAIPLYEVISGTGTLIAGQHTVFDTRITTTSFVTSIAISTTGSITSIPIKWAASNGSMLFNTGQPSDTVMFGYTIYI